MKKLILIGAIGLGLVACNKDKDDNSGSLNTLTIDEPILPSSLANYSQPNLPAYYQNGPVAGADNTPVSNPVSDAGATLGRVLFYEKQMIANGTISCGSCHQAINGFSDPATLSLGFENGLTGRHSMSLANSRYYNNGAFFWDERASTLEAQVLMPIQDEVEMGLTLNEMVERLEGVDYYPALFSAAFGTDEINSDRVSRALAQFVRSMVSFNSKYDEGRAQVNIPTDNFPNFTAPYMHDGRFSTLEEVIEHYNSGVQDNPNLSPPLRLPGGGIRRLNLNANDKAALVAFLQTLSDDVLINDEKFGDPFPKS